MQKKHLNHAYQNQKKARVDPSTVINNTLRSFLKEKTIMKSRRRMVTFKTTVQTLSRRWSHLSKKLFLCHYHQQKKCNLGTPKLLMKALMEMTTTALMMMMMMMIAQMTTTMHRFICQHILVLNNFVMTTPMTMTIVATMTQQDISLPTRHQHGGDNNNKSTTLEVKTRILRIFKRASVVAIPPMMTWTPFRLMKHPCLSNIRQRKKLVLMRWKKLGSASISIVDTECWIS
mmetsp:Transcript_12304/g.17685  ORF Transcript_12304/g.17685 Transcript_12304/m.17685 type:complete len:231 (+) Transcript_12304:577-1269(+)